MYLQCCRILGESPRIHCYRSDPTLPPMSRFPAHGQWIDCYGRCGGLCTCFSDIFAVWKSQLQAGRLLRSVLLLAQSKLSPNESASDSQRQSEKTAILVVQLLVLDRSLRRKCDKVVDMGIERKRKFVKNDLQVDRRTLKGKLSAVRLVLRSASMCLYAAPRTNQRCTRA